MELNLSELTLEERLPLVLKRLFRSYGYARFRMSKFEPYEMYQNNRDFIGSDSFISFTDGRGRLMALKPDVTLSIANALNGNQEKKVYYLESVFRKEHGEYREIYQAGVEHIGGTGADVEAEMVKLAVKALEETGKDFVLSVGDLGFLGGFKALKNLPPQKQKNALSLIGAKNRHELDAYLAEHGIAAADRAELSAAAFLSGGFDEVLALAKKLKIGEESAAALKRLGLLHSTLQKDGLTDRVRLDFSLTLDLSYYNGIVFQGYVAGCSGAVLSGGRYDNLMTKLGKRDCPAVGFALRLSDVFAAKGGETC